MYDLHKLIVLYHFKKKVLERMDAFLIRILVKFRKLNRTVNKNDLNGKWFI